MSRISPTLGADALIRKQLGEALQRSAKDSGHSIVTEEATCEMGSGFTVFTAPIARDEVPTEKELTKGIDLLYAYLSFSGEQKVKPGFYVIRIATSGYDFKAGTTVSVVDTEGKTVHTLAAKSKAHAPGIDDDSPSLGGYSVRVHFSGKKKTLHLQRNGFLDWDYWCTDRSGHVVNCLDRLN